MPALGPILVPRRFASPPIGGLLVMSNLRVNNYFKMLVSYSISTQFDSLLHHIPSHCISPVSLPFSQLAPPDLLHSPLSITLQSRPVLLFWTGLSDARLLYRGTLRLLKFAVLKTVARRRQISYPNLHFCQNSRVISFTGPILPPPNLHFPLKTHFIKI